MRTDIDLEFGDGRYLFRLTIAGISELQEKTGAGLGALFARLLSGRYTDETEIGSFGMPTEAQWHVKDLTETIRLGLLGGGKGEVDGVPVEVTPIIANRLVGTYVIGRPLREAWGIAVAVLTAAIEGVETKEHEVKKKAAPKPRARKTAGSTSPLRSVSLPGSGSTPSPDQN